MLESYLDYHYSYLHPESEWLFITPSIQSQDLNMNVQELGHFIFDGQHHTERGPLQSYQIALNYVPTQGVIQYRGEEFPYPATNGILFLSCTEGYRVETYNHGDSAFVHFWSEEMLYYYELFLRLNGNSPVLNAYSQVVHTNLFRLLSLYRQPNNLHTDIYAQMLVMEIILEIIKLITPRTRGDYSEHVRQTIDLISERYAENLTLDILASEVHVNKYHLSHCFKRETGLTPVRYLQQFRIGRAKELLRTTNMSQETICDKVGIYNSSYLSKLFRAYENLTPDQYRRKWR